MTQYYEELIKDVFIFFPKSSSTYHEVITIFIFTSQFGKILLLAPTFLVESKKTRSMHKSIGYDHFLKKSILNVLLINNAVPLEENLHSPFENLSNIQLHGATVLGLFQPAPINTITTIRTLQTEGKQCTQVPISKKKNAKMAEGRALKFCGFLERQGQMLGVSMDHCKRRLSKKYYEIGVAVQ